MRIAVSGMLGKKPIEGELGEYDDGGAGVGSGVDRVEAALDVPRFIGRGVLLNERDLHAPDLNSIYAASQRRAKRRASAMNTAASSESTSTCGQSCHTGALRQNTFR